MVFVQPLSWLSFLIAGTTAATSVHTTLPAAPETICSTIAGALSSASDVYYPGSTQYASDNFHTYGTSSQASICTVEPGNPQDVGKILGILGSTKTAFAVKSGGHAYNQNFSSTTGVLISMTRFNETVFNPNTSVATVGSGLRWDAVYTALEKHSVSAVGGRIPDVGVAGFLLGGGYSWHTNQHGLGLDNIVAFELVLPSGDIVIVNEESHSDLFFGLRGGWNNFGIVTRFMLKTYPQGQVWGGVLVHTWDHVDEVNAATLQFLKNNDPKAGLIVTYVYTSGVFSTSLLIFYDGPAPPPGIYDSFLAIPGLISNTVATQSFAQLIVNFPLPNHVRGAHGTIPSLAYDEAYLKAVVNETTFWGARLARADPNITLSNSLDPFFPTILSHTRTSSAYPVSRERVLLPTLLEWAYVSPAADAEVQAAIIAAETHLQRTVSGVDLADSDVVKYGNYAWTPGTSAEGVFGKSLPRLRALKRKYDPTGIMELTGGWKV